MTISLKQINIVGLTENQNNPKHTVDSKNQKKKRNSNVIQTRKKQKEKMNKELQNQLEN